MAVELCARCGKGSLGPVELCEGCERVLFGLTNILPWTEFEEAEVRRDDPMVAWAFHAEKLFLNSRYQVAIRSAETPSGKMFHLSIKRIDKQPMREWRDLQRIKNELIGEEFEAVEVFPKESQLVDTSNQYHLWAFPDATFPFAFREGRLLTETPINGSVQTPWPIAEKPAGLKSKPEMIAYAKKGLAQHADRKKDD